MKMSATQIIQLCALALSLLYVIWTTIRICTLKKKETGEVMPNDVLNVIMQQMIKAEELYNNFQNFGKKFSENKLEEVLMKVQNYCLNAGIKYDETVVKEYIDKLIDFSKKVN